MKLRLLLSLLFVLSTQLPATAQHTLVQWNFNSPVPDASTATGTAQPSLGQGTATLIGGVTASFAAGDPKSDPASADNTAWNTSHYPPAAAGNLTAGARFDVDTTGYENIRITWSQRHSKTASRYTRLQYTVDGSDFLNADLILGGNETFTNLTVDLSAAAGVADNPRFAFRVVTEFESSAAGAGPEAYTATADASTYGTTGTIRFDLVTLTGTPLPGANNPPSITPIPDQALRVGQTSPPLPFTIGDAQDPPAELLVTASSSDPSIVPERDLQLAGSGPDRVLSLTAADQPGNSTITLTVTDSGGRSTRTTFTVTVLPLNTTPTIATVPRTNTLAGLSLLLPVTLGDLESGPGGLQLDATSANPGLLDDAAILFEHDPALAARINTLPGRVGICRLRFTASDGELSAHTDLGLLVCPEPFTLLLENFDYDDGSLVTQSPYWQTRSGTVGQAGVNGGRLQIGPAQTEDVVARLAGAPYPATNSTVLYSAFTLKAVSLKEKPGMGLLAHFAEGNTLRGRVFAGTSNAPPGKFRLAVANGSNDAAEFGRDLSPGIAYRVVTRYDVAAATTVLWVDPASEADEAVSAVDAQAPARVSSYGFRQDTDLCGDFEIDELRVAMNWPGVTGTAGPRLEWAVVGGGLVLSWSEQGYGLEWASAMKGPWSAVDGAVSPCRVEIGQGEGGRFYRLRKDSPILNQ